MSTFTHHVWFSVLAALLIAVTLAACDGDTAGVEQTTPTLSGSAVPSTLPPASTPDFLGNLAPSPAPGGDAGPDTNTQSLPLTSVSAGGAHTCGVETGGSVVCWGDDDYGEAAPPTGPFASGQRRWRPHLWGGDKRRRHRLLGRQRRRGIRAAGRVLRFRQRR